ncbi:MAG: sodium/solute symporter [Bryobacterales bacterium]|nr:sodium/solute symporter [Bryobacterales bacterium]
MYEATSSARAAFAAYIALTFLLAYLARRQSSGSGFLREFFIGGRTIGPWVLGLTWIATSASGGTFIGAPSLGHAHGWSVMLWISGYIVVATAGFGLLGRRIAELGERTGALTFPDLLRDRFQSQLIGAISGVAMLVLHASSIVAQYIAGARVLEVALGVPYDWGVASFAVVVAIYTAYGGFRAVAWTDSFQAIVMLFGVLLTAAFGLYKAGGMQAVHDGLAAQSPALLTPTGPDGFLPLSSAISFFFVWPLAVAGQPALITRFLACKDTASLRRASLLIGCYILLLYPAVIFVGILGRVLVPELAASDHAMPATIIAAVPSALAGLVLAAPMAAIMSTISSYLLVAAASITRDLYQRNVRAPVSERRAKTVTHLSIALTGIAAGVFALRPPDYLQSIVIFAGTGLSATFLFPTLLAVFWTRMNRAGCMAGILAGFLSFLLQYACLGTRSFFGVDPFVWSLAASMAACVLGSRAGRPDPRALLAKYFSADELSEPANSRS